LEIKQHYNKKKTCCKGEKMRKRLTKQEKVAENKLKLEQHLKGSGIYEFRNNTKGDLTLPKLPLNGSHKSIPPGGTWQGDSYFLKMVPKEARLVRTIEQPQTEKIETPSQEIQKEEGEKMEQKLILDQPEKVTTEGKVESVQTSDELLTEVPKEEELEGKEKLLNEDPMEGVEIILD
jgi:hypothetical protein